MAYQCQNFKDGQVLTAECLNKIDKALEGACKKEIESITVTAQNELIVIFADGSSMSCGAISSSDALPPVTESDNGKVLKVVAGEWQAADMPTIEPAPTYTGEVEVV